MESQAAILIDSGCAPSPELLNRNQVFQLGMKIKLDDQIFTDGQDLDLDHFYGQIDKVKNFSTTPPLVWDIKKIYEDLKKKGYSSIIAIHVSSKMSKLLETCENAKNMVSGIDIQLIDSQSLSAGASLVAEKIVELIHSGLPIKEIVPMLPEIRKSSYMQISLSTLKYLVKNKRIGRVQGLFGEMLKMRPILGIDADGYLTTLSTERGDSKVVQQITENALKFIDKRPHNMKVCLTWGFDENHQHVSRVFDHFSKNLKTLGNRKYSLSKNRMLPTLACNSGPRAYGFAVYGEEYPLN